MFGIGCDRQLNEIAVDFKDGAMSERLKEHAWKAILVSCIEQYRNISSRSRFNDFPLLTPS
jgi:hypothetical protein